MVFDLSVAFTISLEQVFHMGQRVLDRQTTLQTRFTFFFDYCSSCSGKTIFYISYLVHKNIFACLFSVHNTSLQVMIFLLFSFAPESVYIYNALRKIIDINVNWDMYLQQTPQGSAKVRDNGVPVVKRYFPVPT